MRRVRTSRFAPLAMPGFVLGAMALGLGLTGCSEQTPILRHGTPISADVGYAGDVGRTLPIAQRHCASYERKARLIEASEDIAYYACDPG